MEHGNQQMVNIISLGNFLTNQFSYVVVHHMDSVKRIWYLSPMRAAMVQASLRIHAVSPEPPLLTHTSSESRGTFRQKARSLAPLNGWACAVKFCHDRMLEDTKSFDGAYIQIYFYNFNHLQRLQMCLLSYNGRRSRFLV